MRVLVTGATGLVGANLTRQLVEADHDVRALVFDRHHALEGVEAEVVQGDVREPDSIDAAVAGMDAVVHLAAVIAIERTPNPLLTDVNVVGTRNVVAACRAAGVQRLVHVSSVHALAREPAHRAFDEDRSLATEASAHPYDRSKALGELEVLAGVEQGLDAVILTPVGVFGPHDYGPSPTGELLCQLAHRQVPGLVRAGFWWVDARDVAAACVSALTRGRAGARYLLHSEYVTTPELGAWCAEATGVAAPRLVAPLWLASMTAPLAKAWAQATGRRPLYTPAALDILRHHQVIETTRARDELGFEPRPVRESVHDTVAWLRSDGRIPPAPGTR